MPDLKWCRLHTDRQRRLHHVGREDSLSSIWTRRQICAVSGNSHLYRLSAGKGSALRAEQEPGLRCSGLPENLPTARVGQGNGLCAVRSLVARAKIQRIAGKQEMRWPLRRAVTCHKNGKSSRFVQMGILSAQKMRTG